MTTQHGLSVESVPRLPRGQEQGPRCTPRDLVRLVKPDASDDEADFLLWECSCFPLGTVNEWLSQVREAVPALACGLTLCLCGWWYPVGQKCRNTTEMCDD